MIQVTPSKAILYTGLFGALCIIAFGFSRIAPVSSVPAQPIPDAPIRSHGVIVTTRLIKRGSTIAAADLGIMAVAGAVPATDLTDASVAIGKIAVRDIRTAQLVAQQDVSTDRAQAGLGMLIPLGYRAIALRINDEIAVSNLVQPGDHVDVQIVLPDSVLPGTDADHQQNGSTSEARTLLQNVTVLSVGDRMGDDSSPDADASRGTDRPTGVTLAMTPDQLSEFVLARGIGTMFLALRNPGDPQVVVQDTAVLREVRGLADQDTSGQAKRPIELISGDQHRTIYSVSSVGPK